MSRIDLFHFVALRPALLALALGLAGPATHAGPGAHGPNGEHLDAPTGHSVALSSTPRMEASSDLFELVAHLGGGELAMLIDRFESNEPVLNARVEIESGSIKAKARFHADMGEYAVDDPAMLKLLSQPGEHAVVITVLAGDDSDLLEAVLRVNGGEAEMGGDAHDDHEHQDKHGDNQARGQGLTAWPWAAGALVALGLAGAWRWRRGRRASTLQTTHHGDEA
jgi:hypothetical protein